MDKISGENSSLVEFYYGRNSREPQLSSICAILPLEKLLVGVRRKIEGLTVQRKHACQINSGLRLEKSGTFGLMKFVK